jgi:hypothetical protein
VLFLKCLNSISNVSLAHDEGIPITDPRFYANVSEQQLRYIFRADNPEMQQSIPLFSDRLRLLHETGAILISVRQSSDNLLPLLTILFVEI